MKRIFVGNFPWSVTDADLLAKFSQFGEVASAKVVTDKLSGRSRGFGFVDMPNDTEAQKAIDAVNGSDWSGRQITANEAKPRTDRPQRDRF
jgi:RNA recognition motif-containing protein